MSDREREREREEEREQERDHDHPVPIVNGTAVGAWVEGPQGEWHASIGFDGYTHRLACGFELPATRTGDVTVPPGGFDGELCDGCAGELG